MKELDKVVVPAWVQGLGEDKEGYISKIETFAGRVFYTVEFDTPDLRGGMGIVVFENQLIPKV